MYRDSIGLGCMSEKPSSSPKRTHPGPRCKNTKTNDFAIEQIQRRVSLNCMRSSLNQGLVLRVPYYFEDLGNGPEFRETYP